MDPQSTIALHTGSEMPVLGLGTWLLTHDTAGTVAHALDLGYRMIDTAADYGSQPGIGEAVRRRQVDRAELYVVTKVEETDEPHEAARAYLREIGLDYADLTLIHRPPPGGAGAELWEELIRVKRDGLAVDIGVSNYAMDRIDELSRATGEVPAVNQVEWSPFGFSAHFLERSRQAGIVVQAYSPLTRARRLDDPTLLDVGARYGKSPAQILIRWNLQRGTVPLPKANRRTHLEENIGVFDFRISEDDIARLNSLNEHYSSLGVLPYV